VGNFSERHHSDEVSVVSPRECRSAEGNCHFRPEDGSAYGGRSAPSSAPRCLVQLAVLAGSAVRASIWAWSKVTTAAVALAVTSCADSAPTMTEATAGRDSSQARDTWYGCKPHSWLSRSTARPISSSVPVKPEPPNL